jgi:hypothetical protein
MDSGVPGVEFQAHGRIASVIQEMGQKTAFFHKFGQITIKKVII